jgi:hypothetical protein
MMMQNQRSERLCVYCGAPATSNDHVPPRGLFLPPLPSNLIAVPACVACNNGASVDDERFRNFVSLTVGTGTPARRALWDNKALKSIRRNRKEHRPLIRSMRDVDLRSPNGLYLGRATRCAFEAAPHDSGIRRIVRGLYWHHYHEVLGNDVPIRVYIPEGSQWVTDLAEPLSVMEKRRVGSSSEFQYAFGLVKNYPAASMWAFLFYGSHAVISITGLPEDLSQLANMADAQEAPVQL